MALAILMGSFAAETNVFNKNLKNLDWIRKQCFITANHFNFNHIAQA
jgi:hypothetical protein